MLFLSRVLWIRCRFEVESSSLGYQRHKHTNRTIEGRQRSQPALTSVWKFVAELLKMPHLRTN